MGTISLIANAFIPTSSFTGGESPTVLRGSNAKVRAVAGRAKIENYPGSKDLGEDYDISLEQIGGTITYNTGSLDVVGVGTSFLSELRQGQKILSASGEPISIRSITDDTNLIAERPATTSAAGVAAYYLLILFECDKKRGVLRRGNAITHERKDIYYVGDGELHLNGTATGFTATRRPKRLQRASDGTYTEFEIGFDTPPPSPTVEPVAGGWKGMQAGKFSFMFSWWNSVTDGFSNPSNVIKQFSGTDITITAGQRFKPDLTALLAVKPTNADGVLIWGSQSGGGVADVNASNFAEGAWLECARIRTTPYTIADADVDIANDKITVPGHKFRTAQSIFFNTTWGPFTANTEYFAIYDGTNTIKVATTAANANAGTAINIAADPGVGSHTVGALNPADDTTFFEYLDAEMGRTASGTNFPPPECEWVTEFANTVHYISAFGKKTVTKTDGTSPGNYVVPMKDTNREAAPPDWKVSVGDEITGFSGGIGRLFCQTPNDVKFVTPTGRTELARLNPTQLDQPFSSRPFWTKGGISPYNILVVQGDVFLYNGRTLLRSPSNADTNVVPFEIGLPVADLTAEWYDGYVLLGHDGKNQEVCLISSASKKNPDGYWVSEILPYSLQKNEWQPIITVSSSTRDMIISGVATVGGRMQFLAGGRVSGGDFTLSTFQYDEISGEEVPWYVAFQPTDSGEEQRPKQIKSLRITARGNVPMIQVHGTTPSSRELSIDDIEDGTNSVSGNITLTASPELAREFAVPYKVKNLGLWCIRYADTYEGSGPVNRLDEIVVGIEAHGIAR